MTYTPTKWQTGDLITADKLNKLEGAAVDDVNSKTVRHIEAMSRAELEAIPTPRPTDTVYLVKG